MNQAILSSMDDHPHGIPIGTADRSDDSTPSTRVAEFEAEALPHMNDLFRTATRLLNDRAKAEDVIQEVYLQAWKSYDRYERGTNCRAWLFQILFHSVHHYRRKWFRLQLFRDTDELMEANLTATPSLPDKLTDEEILAALDHIPNDFKAVVLLADVEEFAYKEISTILNIPIGTVMSRLSRGRKLLRERLAQVAESYGIGKTDRKEKIV